MTIRESLEQREKEYLSPYASLSMNSPGRLRDEVECDIRKNEGRRGADGA